MKLTYGALDLTTYPFSIIWGSDFGAPQNVTEAYAFMLQDGEVELSDRASNRTLQFSVLVEGADLGECAVNEAALVAESEKPRNTIALDPEDSGPVTVYDTFRAQVTLARDDAGELSRLRIYTVTVRALPFGRSVDEVVAPALSTGSTTNNVDTAGSATGWTGYNNGVAATVTADAGPPTTIKVEDPSGVGTVTLALQKTVSVTTSSLKYLIVDWRREPITSGLDRVPLVAIGDGVVLSRVAEGGSPTGGYTRTWFLVAASSLGVLRLEATTIDTTSNGSGVTFRDRLLQVDNVAISDVRPFVGTAHQQIQTIAVAGSTRTQAALALESPTSALGDAIIYVYAEDQAAAGYVPALRQYRTAGGTVGGGAANVSGGQENITGAGVTFQVPVARLPRGLHLLVARLNSGAYVSATTLTWTAQTTLGGVNMNTVTDTFAVPLTSGFANFAVGRIMVPTADVSEASTAVLTLNLHTSSGCDLDEAWLFSADGRLTQVSCGTGTAAAGGPASRIFMEPATVAAPRPTIRVGYAADRSDAYYPQTVSGWQFPECAPPAFAVFTSTSNATDSVLKVRHFPYWHTNAAS